MWSDTMYCLKMLRMHEQSCELVTISLKSEQYTKSDIIDTPLHRTIHRLGVICVIMLWSGWMQFLVSFLIISLLEQNVGSDSCILQLAVILNGCCRDVDIHTTDCTVLVLDAVDRIDAL